MKKIKRIFIFAIIIILMLQIFNKVQANSSEINMDIVDSIKEKSEITVLIDVSSVDNGILGIQGTLDYDRNVLELIDKKIKKDNWIISAFNEETGIFMLEITDDAFYDKSSYIYEKEQILELTLKVKDEVNIDKTSIGLVDLKVVDENFETTDIENQAYKTIKISNNHKFVIIGICVSIIALGLIIHFTIVRKKGKRK